VTDSPSEVDLLKREVAFQGYVRVSRYHLRHRKFDGGWSAPMVREVVERGGVVGILLYDPGLDRVVLIEQFRVGALAAGQPAWMYEIVAGVIDHGESPGQVARREAEEEAGCTVSALELIGGYMVSPGVLDEHLTLFVGRIDAATAGGIHGLAHEHEDIRVFTVSAEEAIALLDTPRLDNSLVIIALNWFARHHQALRQRWLAEPVSGSAPGAG